ncbi:hypothetical protein MPTK1_8g06610 [Marchantia polymorpha subsp. ruderalis]|nr:hypothetical protein MARPO_0013s0131 [Marchantia polymorpha]BBN18920.1 hypothetical protein Mp_8g06610 [Marchantia polymorpha subsp. ruderalis]|eukprot:PTQ45926.1 hypothetical protein MARPO_0013s0131 [Marchantia polymorpha]
MATSATIPAEGDEYFIINKRTARFLVDRQTRMIFDTAYTTGESPRPEFYGDLFRFNKSASGNGSWIIRAAAVGRMLTKGDDEKDQEGILGSSGIDSAGTEWDVIPSSYYEGTYHIRNHHTQDLIFDLPSGGSDDGQARYEGGNVPLKCYEARYGKVDETDTKVHWIITKEEPTTQ